MHNTIAMQNRPQYPYAMAGLATIAVCEKNFYKALELFQRADSLIPDHFFKEGIAEVFELSGWKDKADSVKQQILDFVTSLNSNNGEQEGQHEDHEMAHAYLGVGQLDQALNFAVKEYNRRPGNIEVNATVAWILYKKGEFGKALPYLERALSTNNKKTGATLPGRINLLQE